MRLLVVDDKPTMRKVMQRYLQERGYDVTVAEDGAEAWQAIRVDPPDMVVSDVLMPNMDGHELLRSIRRTPATSRIPIILVSAQREKDQMVAGYESGADDYLAKPFDLQLLGLKVEALRRRVQAAEGPLPQSPGHFVAVTSAKGGVGVSTLVVNLSILLAAGGRSTVCACDLNLASGDLDVLLDMQPRATLVDVAAEVGSAGEGFAWDDYLERHITGPRLLAAPPRRRDAETVIEEQIVNVMRGVRTAHDFVVADAPGTSTNQIAGVLSTADKLVVVTSPEISSLRRTRELLEEMTELGMRGDRVLLVLNRCIDVTGIDARKAEAFLQRAVTVTIPNGGPTFTEAVSLGRPVAMTQPHHPAVEAMQRLADVL